MTDTLLSNVLKLSAIMGCTIDDLLDEQTREELLEKPIITKQRRKGAKNGTEK